MPARRSYLLTDLSWVEVEAHLTGESRLIVPVGCLDQYGRHLPLGAATLVTDAFAARLSDEFGVLRAPPLPYGVNLPGERRFPGAASLGEKTLHRTLNDLLAGWEDCGFTEFILLTAHDYDPHSEAIATVSATSEARVRVVELLNLDLSGHLKGKASPAHAGEVLTSLLLHLQPDRVRSEAIDDFYPYGPAQQPPHRLTRLPPESDGVLGFPSLASAETGRRIFEHILQKLRLRIFLEAEPES